MNDVAKSRSTCAARRCLGSRRCLGYVRYRGTIRRQRCLTFPASPKEIGRPTPPTSRAPATRRSIRSTPSNFNKLEVAWRFKTDNLGTRPEFKLEGTPLMVKGVIYATGGTRRSVVALDAKTGELIWVHAEKRRARAR